MSTPPATVQDALDRSGALVEQRRVREAITLLTEANRAVRDPLVEARLVEIRHEGFDAIDRANPDPPDRVVAGATNPALVERRAADLDVEVLREDLASQGCVLVRGLVDEAEATRLAAGIDAALDGFDRYGSDDPAEAGWHTPFRPRPGAYRVGGRRTWVRSSGAVWTADAPRMLFELTELVERTGIGALVTEYLGERPALSANKCTLRRVPLTAMAGWHQDGAFLGEEVRSLNLWLGLTPCGVDSPGLDLVPRRIDRIVETGTEGAIFDWSVASDVVAREAVEAPVVRPEFRAGDALLFDHMFLHSTAVTDAMVRERYAMETWFFAPSAYPEGQIPLVL
ncbi:MAG: phytanoyl-CoA dioxygenase family protein [Actinobacteria bacterium]|nr:phytanoyl-CoA dioxygenase family protein [Actinomycetota bacterium]